MFSILQSNQVNATLFKVKNFNYNNDRIYTIAPLIETLSYLLEHNIKDVSDFISSLTNVGMKSKDIVECIKKFVRDFNENNKDQKIEWFKSRSFRQLSYYHKNFIIARLIYEHGQSLLVYFRKYMKNFLSNEEVIEFFISEMKLKFDKITKQTNNTSTKLHVNSIEIKDINLFDDLKEENNIGDYFNCDDNDENLEYELFGYF